MNRFSAFSRSARRRTRAPDFWWNASRALAVVLIAVGIAGADRPATAVETFPLDSYPGLGRSPESALRNDTIAAWEAFRREQIIASCMAQAGFEYLPAVAFPRQPLTTVAEGLGVVDKRQAGTTSPASRNRAYAEALSADARDGYYGALVGESAADIAEAQRTGQVPSGRGVDFARGGCSGVANAAVPSLWDLKLELAAELDAVRQAVTASAELEATRSAYAACAQQAAGINARGPAELEALAARGATEAGAIRTVAKACADVWRLGYRRAELAALRQFEVRNATRLLAAQERYRGVMTTISQDEAFRTYLSQYAGVE